MKLILNSIGYGLLSIVCYAGLNSMVYAKPEITRLGANIAESGSNYYDFQFREFSSSDHATTYRVWLGIPKRKQNRVDHAAYPALFMLDGNAVMSYLNDHILKKLTQNDAPVLVAIGYKTDLPFEVYARSLDYTPADLITGQPAPDPRSSDRMSGGSHDFSKLMLDKIVPWVEQNVKLDANHRAIWGHSYGGLFVLDHLLDGKYFSHYFAASPSLSWANDRIIKKIKAVPVKRPNQKHLLLIEGDVLWSAKKPQSKNFDPCGIDKNREILAVIAQQGVNAQLLIYPNLTHGAVFQTSLIDVLMYKYH